MSIIIGLFWLFYLVENNRLLMALLLFSGVGGAWFLQSAVVPSISSNMFETLQWRVNLWYAAFHLIQDYPLVLLYGNGTELLLPYLPASISEPHNLYIYLTLTYGMGGLLLMVLLVIVLIAFGWRDRLQQRMRQEPILAGLWFAILGFLLVGFFEVNLQEIELRMLFLLVICCYIGLSRELRTHPESRV
jgi:O-antigen ligase